MKNRAVYWAFTTPEALGHALGLYYVISSSQPLLRVVASEKSEARKRQSWSLNPRPFDSKMENGLPCMGKSISMDLSKASKPEFYVFLVCVYSFCYKVLSVQFFHLEIFFKVILSFISKGWYFVDRWHHYFGGGGGIILNFFFILVFLVKSSFLPSFWYLESRAMMT